METNINESGIPKRRALGRGLEELFNSEILDYSSVEEKIVSETPKDEITMIDLAECYKNGSIVRQDYGESMKYYQMAAELDKIDDNTKDTNQLKALFAIGTFYENGYGVDKNSSKAIFWYRKAANKNYTPAQEALKRLDTNWVDETGHATRGKENNNINDELPF